MATDEETCPSCEGDDRCSADCPVCSGAGIVPTDVEALASEDRELDRRIAQAVAAFERNEGRITLEEAGKRLGLSESRVARGLRRMGVHRRKGPPPSGRSRANCRFDPDVTEALEALGPTVPKAVERIVAAWHRGAALPPRPRAS